MINFQEEKMKKIVFHLPLILLVIFALALISCGGKKEQNAKKEETSKIDEAKEFAEGFKAASEAIQAMHEEEKKEPVDPVNFRELISFLPSPTANWKISEKASGQTQSFGAQWKYSEVSQRYSKGDSDVVVSIKDGAYIPMLYTMFAFQSAYEQDSTEKFQKGFTVGENKGFEEFYYQDKNGKVNLLIEKRFIIEVRGDGIDSNEVLHTYLSKIDMKKLGALANK